MLTPPICCKWICDNWGETYNSWIMLKLLVSIVKHLENFLMYSEIHEYPSNVTPTP